MPNKGYQPLPTGPMSPSSNTNTHAWPIPKWMPRCTRIRPRQLVMAVSILTLFATTASFFYWDDLMRYSFPERSPWASDATNFDEVFLRESTLPQHDLSAPFPEGKDGRFVRFSNQVWGLGWNNILQERLLNTILAYESNRAPVFTPFEAWAHPPRNDSDSKGERKVLSIPYNALVSGPTAGGSWGSGDRHPRAVTDKWWEIVCPLPKRVVIKADDVFEKFKEKNLDGKRTVEEWSSLLRDIPENCVEIVGTQIFDFYLIGSTRVLPLWDSFSKHPAIERLDDSEIVKAAVQQNIGKLQAVDGFSWRPAIWQPKGIIAGLAAVHIRRGDYLEGGEEGHCVHLSKWGSTYTGWNQLPQLYDTFTPPPRRNVPWGENSPELEDYYLQHCLPTPKQVASRLRAVQSGRSTRLSHVYVATNAEKSYLDELRTVLVADGWSSDAIVTSNDLKLNWQAESVAMAVDMSILSRAEMFVGNGFSSMTSNVVMKRLTTGMPLDTVRFW